MVSTNDEQEYETRRVMAKPCEGEPLNQRLKSMPWHFEWFELVDGFDEMGTEERILYLLREPRQLTVREAQKAINSTKFRARVTDLRDRGFVIDGPMVKTTTGKQVKDYRLQKDPEEGVVYDWIDPIRESDDVEVGA